MEAQEESMTSSEEDSGTPIVPPDSPGSSISTRMQEEYDELLKYAVIVPSYDPTNIPKSLTDFRGSFPHYEEDKRYDVTGMTSHMDSHPQNDQDSDTVEDRSEVGSVSEVDQSHEYIEPVPRGGPSREPAFRGSASHESPAQQPRQHPTLRDADLGDPMFTRKFARPDSPVSSVSEAPSIHESESSYSVSIDQDVSRMERLLDQWTGDLRRNVLSEFGQSKIRLIEYHRHQMLKEKARHGAEKAQQQNEVEGLKELLHTYERSIERKDQVISNLTRGLQKQKQNSEVLRAFCEWRAKHNDAKREAFATKIAERHHERALQRRYYDAWHSVVESKWRTRVEKACQSKAQEVCINLTNDYEASVASLSEALEAARVEVAKLHAEREAYEETMKKAFMRGVCALNMEAMAMFQEADGGAEGRAEEDTPPDGDTLAPEAYPAYTVAQEPVYTSHPPGGPPARVVTGQTASRGPTPGAKVITAQSKVSSGAQFKGTGRGRVVTAKVSGRGEPRAGYPQAVGAPTLAPPMSSVIVERHQPITKQTIGHATAMKYPTRPSNQDIPPQQQQQQQQAGARPSIVHRKIAGQAGSVPLAAPNIQTVKVVD